MADAADAVKFEDLLFLVDGGRLPIASEGFQCCSLNFTGVGIEIQHDDQQQWFVPWEAMPEVFDGTWDLQVPESHPHVKQLRARFSFGFSSCTGCKFHLASCSPDQLDSISRIVQLRSSQAVAIEGLPGSETDHVEINEAQSYLDDSDVTSGSPLAITAPATLPYSSVIVTPRAPPRIEAATPQPVMSQREMIGAHSNLQMPQELLAALLDQPQVPEPLTLQHAWLHLPPFCAHFHRCLVSVDKLGLSLRPLGRSKRSSELHATGLKLLHTESLSFPLSAILDAEEVPELAPPVPMNSSGEQQTFGRQFGRKQGLIPLARLCFSRRASSKPQKPCPESAERLPAAASYFVVVKLRAGVAGKMPGQERIPACMRMRDSRPPLQLALALYEKDEVTKLIASVLSFKSYQASTALQSILFKMRAIHTIRSKIPSEEAEPQDAPTTFPTSQPRIISNEDGEVFWYVPKKDNGSGVLAPKARQPGFSEDRGTISI